LYSFNFASLLDLHYLTTLSDPGQLNSQLNEDPSEEHFKSEPNSPTSAEASAPTGGSASNLSENSLQSRISATASRNLVSALKDVMKVTKKNQKIISHEIGIRYAV
jgi:hypothetical protein